MGKKLNFTNHCNRNSLIEINLNNYRSTAVWVPGIFMVHGGRDSPQKVLIDQSMITVSTICIPHPRKQSRDDVLITDQQLQQKKGSPHSHAHGSRLAESLVNGRSETIALLKNRRTPFEFDAYLSSAPRMPPKSIAWPHKSINMMSRRPDLPIADTVLKRYINPRITCLTGFLPRQPPPNAIYRKYKNTGITRTQR